MSEFSGGTDEMSTLIELEEPFKSKWRKGYLQTHPNGRKYVCLFNSRYNRTIISYARYRASVKENRFLSSSEEIDHKDNNKENDSLENLQILSKVENLHKQHQFYKETVQKKFEYNCAWCNNVFILTERFVKMRISHNVAYAFCSRHCAALFHHNKNRETLNRIDGRHLIQEP